jgi:hypothetical protein
MMLLPRFTIRSLLALTVLAAIVAWILQQATVGALWAQCAAWTFVFMGAIFATYAGLFLGAWFIGQILGMLFPAYVPVESPFATAERLNNDGAALPSPFAEAQRADEPSSPSS